MNRKIRVLVVDDDALFRRLVPEQIESLGFETAVAASGEEALAALTEADYDVLLLDIQMPGLSGLDALREIKKRDEAPEVIMLTADPSLASGIEAMRLGAYDYLTKPAPLEEMDAVIRKADEKRRLVRQNASLRDMLGGRPVTGEDESPLVRESEAMRRLLAQAEAVARLDSTVLITGESGTGKDVLARFIHARSQRAAQPMISINCGALPDQLFESEFFGYERGAFTGASQTKRGLIEAADSSTLFLDEVGEMPAASQVKLLRFLEQSCFRRIGATRDQRADVRVVAATNRDLLSEVGANRFRADLFYRLNVIALDLPPLRERREDVLALLDHFLSLYSRKFNRPTLALSREARRRFETHDYPGNVRELRNAVERAAALATDDLIDADLVALQSTPAATMPAAASRIESGNRASDIVPTLEELTRRHIFDVLARAAGNRERAAALLGISERTLYRKLREYEA